MENGPSAISQFAGRLPRFDPAIYEHPELTKCPTIGHAGAWRTRTKATERLAEVAPDVHKVCTNYLEGADSPQHSATTQMAVTCGNVTSRQGPSPLRTPRI